MSMRNLSRQLDLWVRSLGERSRLGQMVLKALTGYGQRSEYRQGREEN